MHEKEIQSFSLKIHEILEMQEKLPFLLDLSLLPYHYALR